MARPFVVLLVLALAACSTAAPQQAARSPCELLGEAHMECQIERYHNINVP